uniref:Uncharacterized protein n=1 Tax=Amphimedon queenslandica TaxID=400682 RepID=A0A1X7U808_AMPQE
MWPIIERFCLIKTNSKLVITYVVVILILQAHMYHACISSAYLLITQGDVTTCICNC